MTKIQWTQETWNPTTGCTKVSAGCKFCYAEIMAKRLQAMGLEKYSDGFSVKIHPDALNLPYKWRKPKMIFVNSMSDLFHNDIPIEFIKQVFAVMNSNPHHTFQVLTKRSERLAEVCNELNWTDNIWMGVSVENEKVLGRVADLGKTPAKIKFLSCEPLLEGLPNLSLENINWVIVGGESGRNPRPMAAEWVLQIKEKCEINNVPFFFKQWGGKPKDKNNRLLNGRTYDEMPFQTL